MHRLLFVLFISLTSLLNSNYALAYEKEIKSLSAAMTENIAKAGKKTIAVVDFVDLQGNITELGRFIAEEFSTALAGADKGFEVVERIHLKSILKEQKLAITGMVDPTTAKKLGQIVGVDALITGTITPFGDSVRLSVKILDTSTAKIIGALSGDIAKTKAIEELLGRGVEQTSPSPMPVAGKAVEAEGFVFKPVKCWRKGDKLICTISFQNVGDDDRRLCIYARSITAGAYSFLYDNRGNQYSVMIQIGDKYSRGSFDKIFVPQLPVNVHFITENVHPEATHITATIAIGKFKKLVTIRDIPITK